MARVDWRTRFAPTDFSQLLEAPSVSMTYVPYYCTAVRHFPPTIIIIIIVVVII
jgi:hypothetical protein